MTDWTPRQAGYDPTSSTPGITAGGSLVEFCQTRHGVLARVWLSATCTEIFLRRPTTCGATHQGSVKLLAAGWVGFDPANRQVTEPHLDRAAAEAPLLRLRTGRRAATRITWPTNLTGGPR